MPSLSNTSLIFCEVCDKQGTSATIMNQYQAYSSQKRNKTKKNQKQTNKQNPV